MMLGFKEESDLHAWRTGVGNAKVRHWISLFNSISEVVCGKSCVVTSWFREDNTFHKDGMAVDFRTRIYSNRQLSKILNRCVNAGMPVSSLYRNTDNQHIHCGDLMTLKIAR
jgi:hypothetical protein